MSETFAPDDLDLGPCCACETTENVRNVMCLDKKASVPGKGWGCFVCGLPNDGAVTVLCDRCLEDDTPIRFAVNGWATDQGRVPLETLGGEHRHDLSKHPDEVSGGVL